MDSWLKLFGYSWNDIVGMEYSAATLYTPSTLDCPKDYNIGHLGVISGLRCLTENVQNGFSALSFVPPPMLRDGSGDSRRNYLPGIAFRKPSLGNGVLLSRVQDRATVAVVDATSGGALKDVLTSVLDSAFWLDMRTIQGDQDVFYFVKESNTKLADDQENLKRLSGVFNISLVENEQGAGSEVRVSNAELALVLTYGVGVQQAKHRLLRLAHRRAIEGAWLREKQLVEAGLPGQVEWTPEERAELIANGQVEGFTGGDLHSIYDYPLLADDPSNIIFRRDTKRKRRKSRRFRPYVWTEHLLLFVCCWSAVCFAITSLDSRHPFLGVCCSTRCLRSHLVPPSPFIHRICKNNWVKRNYWGAQGMYRQTKHPTLFFDDFFSPPQTFSRGKTENIY